MKGRIHKRGGTWGFVVDVGKVDSKRKQLTRGGFRTKKEAESALHDVLTKLHGGSYVQPSRLTLDAFLADVWLPHVRAERRASTVESYERNLRVHVLPELGQIELQRLSALDLDRLYRRLRESGRKDGKGLSPRSVRYVHTIVHGALGYALRKGLVTRNVADAADAPTSRAARAPAGWSPEDVRAFLGSVRDDRLYGMWLLLATTGMRRGEVLALDWPSADLDTGRVTIRRSLVVVGYRTRLEAPKTESGRRTIPLDPYTVSVLRELRRRQAEERLALGPAYADDGLLFCREDGAALHPDRVSKLFKAAAKRAGLSPVRLHDVRHAAATAMIVRGGVDPRTVAARLGHHSPAFTMTFYTHALREQDEAAAATLARLVSPSLT